MRKSILFLFLFAMHTLCQAQSSITGILKSADDAPIDFANIVLLTQADSTFITGTTSREDGSFSVTMPAQEASPYLMRITCIGYKTICMPAQAGSIGSITLEDDAQMLSEVTVKGNLPVTRLKAGAMITNVEGSVLAKAGTAQDLLDYIPGVASQKGSLNVLGRGTPIVYINGRLVRDNSELDQLSSDNIKSVEVINNPGARYSASVRAVIKIHTKKPVGEGLGLSSRTYTTFDDKYWDALQQLNVNYRKGGLDVFGLLFFYGNKDWNKFTLKQDSYLDQHWQQQFKADAQNEGQNFIADFGMNYVFNPNHSMGFKYRYDRTPKGVYDTSLEADVAADGTPYESIQSSNTTSGQETVHSTNFYYNGSVSDWNIDFNADLLWTDEWENQRTKEAIASAGGTPTERTVTTASQTNNKLYASKLVLTHPLLGGTVSFGGEFSHTNRDADYLNHQAILDDDESEIKESNTAAFVELSRGFGKLQLQAGLRYEHVGFDYYDEGVFKKEQSKKYDNLFPTIAAAMSIGKVQLQLGYAQDISRPGFYSLRNSVSYANHYTYESGNPFLLPSISHNVSLMAQYKWMQLSATYTRQEDDVTITTEAYSDDNPNIILFKPINIKGYNTAYAMLSASPTIGLWSPRFTAMVKKQWYETETYTGVMQLNKPQVYLRWQNTFKLPADFLFTLNGSWNSKYNMQNSYSNKSSWGIDAGLNKSFFNNRFTVQLNAYDIFLTRRYSQVSYSGSRYVMTKVATPNSRSVSLTLRYRFNQARNKYKGSGAGSSQKNRL